MFKLMYYCLNLEQIILASIIIKNNLIDIDLANFYFKIHKIIYINLKSYFNNYYYINIYFFFKKKNIVILYNYLLKLIQKFPNISNIKYCIKLLIYLSLIRNLIKNLSLIIKNKFKSFKLLFNFIKINLFNLKYGNVNLLSFIINKFKIELKKKFEKILTGFIYLDKILLGLEKGDLIVIAGRPSTGKTAFCINIALNIVFKNNLTVLIISMEMSSLQILNRILSFFSNLDQNIIRSKELNNKELELLFLISKKIYFSKIFINENTRINLNSILDISKNIINKYGNINLIIIDYLQLIKYNYNINRSSEISEISRTLKYLAKELKIPIIIISQLNRSIETRGNKIPIMSDLKESGSIEQDADVILLMYKDLKKKKKINIIISKQRNGPTGKIILNFYENFLKFN